MKDLFKKIEENVEKLVAVFLGLVVILLLVITFAQVLVRYIFNVSLGGMEELPIYLMIIGIWVGGVLLSKDNSHLKLDCIGLVVKNQKVIGIINLIVDIISVAVVGYCSYLMIDYALYCVEQGMITPGMSIPISLFAFIIAICIGLMAVFKIIRVVKQIKGGITK